MGDRIAQIIIEKLTPIEIEVVDELEKTDRGQLGFGSTGIKEKIIVDKSQDTSKLKRELQNEVTNGVKIKKIDPEDN